VNSTLVEVVGMCQPGARVVDICKAGDASIVAKTDAIYRQKKDGKKIEKGIAFPVCVSVNNCVCHFTPLESEEPQVVLALGDMVKIDLGCHIDGYIAVAAHTITVGQENAAAPPAEPITGPAANCVRAAFLGAEVAARLIKPGNNNKQVSDAVKAVADAFGVQAIAGTLMHQMKRYIIDGTKMILLREIEEQRVPECQFEVNEVYAVDVAMTTGEGKPREIDTRTTVFKRNVDRTYNLKMKASRGFFSEVKTKFPTLPFTLRGIEDERQAKLGVRECVQHELLSAYPVLFERPEDIVCHVKFTLLLLPGGNSKITGLELSESIYSSDRELPEDIRAILATELNAKKKKRIKKKTAAAGEEETA